MKDDRDDANDDVEDHDADLTIAMILTGTIMTLITMMTLIMKVMINTMMTTEKNYDSDEVQ